MQHLHDRAIGLGDLVPCRDRPARQVMAHHQFWLLQLHHALHVLTHACVVAVAPVPGKARQTARTLGDEVPIVVKQAGPIDLDPVDLRQLQARPVSGGQYRDAVPALLQALDRTLQNDFCAAADIGRVEAIYEKDFHSG